MMKNVIWWTFFLVATFALSKVFEATRLFTSESPEASIMLFLGWVAVLVVSFLVLGYEPYRKAKVEGKVTRQIGFYEKFYQLQQREKCQ